MSPLFLADLGSFSRFIPVLVPGAVHEGKISETVMALISLQSLVVDNATIPQMKAIHVLFQLIYGSLINSKGLQSDRPI